MGTGAYRVERRPQRSFLWRLSAAAFALNWVWENVQMAFYASYENAAREFLICSAAAVGDALLTLVAYGALTALFTAFGLKGRRGIDYPGLAFCGALIAVVIERIALAAGFWSYADAMPIVPYLDVGLLPLIQLVLLMPAALWLTGVSIKKEIGRSL